MSKKHDKLTILSIDPGETTGMVLFSDSWQNDVKFYLKHGFVGSWQLKSDGSASSEYEVANVVANTLFDQQSAVFLYEDFILYGGSHSSDRSGLSPVRINSAVMTLLLDRGVWLDGCVQQMNTQLASEAKTPGNRRTVKAAKIKGLKGVHATDAALHVVCWLRKNEARLDAGK